MGQKYPMNRARLSRTRSLQIRSVYVTFFPAGVPSSLRDAPDKNLDEKDRRPGLRPRRRKRFHFVRGDIGVERPLSFLLQSPGDSSNHLSNVPVD
jgi:hypothetical protein